MCVRKVAQKFVRVCRCKVNSATHCPFSAKKSMLFLIVVVVLVVVERREIAKACSWLRFCLIFVSALELLLVLLHMCLRQRLHVFVGRNAYSCVHKIRISDTVLKAKYFF